MLNMIYYGSHCIKMRKEKREKRKEEGKEGGRKGKEEERKILLF